MNPIKYILKAKIQRGWKIVILSFLLAAFIGLPLMFLASFVPSGFLQTSLGLVSIFVVVAGLVSMIGGFFIVLYDLYKS
ncbi:TMEM134 family protein [Kangiella shandongensis]|uniref:TMEM134 family protein n=1 Tax=Kangiella shandongensis TaxID=2763258 RepID=UPI001CBBB14F|nr:TMEM134 family protein [Kangiella shandongensis]